MNRMPHAHKLHLQYADTTELTVDPMHRMDVMWGKQSGFAYALKDDVKLILEGSGCRIERALSGGEGCYIPGNCNCTVMNGGDGVCRLLLIRFQSESALVDNLCEVGSFRMPQMAAWAPEFIHAEEATDAQYYKLQARLYAIASCIMEAKEQRAVTRDSLHCYVEKTRRFMQEHYNEPIDVDETAVLSGASPSRFYQAFKKHTGFSPHKYLTMIRLNESLHVLSQPSATVKSSAHAVGYQDELYFSRLFRKNMGISPTDYMVCARKRIVSLCPAITEMLVLLGMKPAASLHEEWEMEGITQLLEEAAPEIILAPGLQEELYIKIAEMAPTIMIPGDSTWEERLLQVSSALGIPGVAERYLDNEKQRAVPNI